MTKAYISVGSNISPESNIRSAISLLGQVFGVLEVSPVYRSPAQGFVGADFLNLAIGVETAFSPEQLHKALSDVEAKLGRERDRPKFSDRTLDLDLLVYGNEIVSDDKLEIPRPEIEEYAHVLVPLTDLAANEKHPLSGRSYLEMNQDMQSRDPSQFTVLTEIVFLL